MPAPTPVNARALSKVHLPTEEEARMIAKEYKVRPKMRDIEEQFLKLPKKDRMKILLKL